MRGLGLAATLPNLPYNLLTAALTVPTVFDVKQYGALGNGLVNDTAAVQRAVDAATAQGVPATVFFPAGTYRLEKRIDALFAVACHGNGITFRGLGSNSKIVTDTPEGCAFLVHGGGKPAGDTNWWPNSYHNLPQQPILPAQRGATSVRLANAADASLYAVGATVYIRTGQILDNYPGYTEPDSEINEVTAVAGDTLTLRWPLAKPYTQEYYVAGTTGSTSTTPTDNAAPLAISNASAVTMRDVAFRDLAFDVTGDSGAIAGGQIVGLRLTNLTGTYKSVFQSMGDYRSARIDKLRLTGRGRGIESTYIPVTTSKGTTDVKISDNTFSAEGLCMIHLHEGSAKVTFEGNSVTSAPNHTGNHVISIRGRAYGITVAKNTITGGALNGFAVIADYTCVGGGRIEENTITGEFVLPNPIDVQTSGWVVAANTFGLAPTTTAATTSTAAAAGD